MWIKKKVIELYLEELTWFKLGKEYDKAVYSHPSFLTYMSSTTCEMLTMSMEEM